MLPSSFETQSLASWTERPEPAAQAFAGTARYRTQFAAPAGAGPATGEGWILDLGRVCQSARVRLNGEELGTVFIPPYRVWIGHLPPGTHRLEIEVTNVSANRIRDLDRRGVAWRTFHDINFVNMDYKAFDASNWPLTESGLLGPVRLIPAGTAP